MKVHCGSDTITVPCNGACYCHHMAITFGEHRGCCVECGCPKTNEGFQYLKQQQEHS